MAQYLILSPWKEKPTEWLPINHHQTPIGRPIEALAYILPHVKIAVLLKCLRGSHLLYIRIMLFVPVLAPQKMAESQCRMLTCAAAAAGRLSLKLRPPGESIYYSTSPPPGHPLPLYPLPLLPPLPTPIFSEGDCIHAILGGTPVVTFKCVLYPCFKGPVPNLIFTIQWDLKN